MQNFLYCAGFVDILSEVMQLSPFDYALWFASPALQAVLAVCMLKRRLYRSYPFFFNYTLLAVISDPILAVIHAFSYTAYYYAYYVHLGLSVLLSFLVLQEIFQNAFRPYEALRDLGVILFRWSALVVFLVAVMWALSAKPDKGVLENLFLLADRSLRLAQCGLVFFLLLLSEYLGIPHSSFLFGISLGFGFFAAVNMLVVTGGSTHHAAVSRVTLGHINSAAYLITVMIWFGYTLAGARSRSELLEGSPVRSRDWNSALQEARTPIAESSLLDTMDRTVERLLYPPEGGEVRVPAKHG